MKVVLSGPQDSAKCVWCEKDRETVQATFSDGLFKNASICWRCLKQACKVRSQQSDAGEAASGKIQAAE